MPEEVKVADGVVTVPEPQPHFSNNPFDTAEFAKGFEEAMARDSSTSSGTPKEDASTPERPSSLDAKTVPATESTPSPSPTPKPQVPEITKPSPKVAELHGKTKEENLGILRTQRDEARTEIVRLQQELESAKNGGGQTAELRKLNEQLAAQNKSLNERLSVLDVTATDWFKQRYTDNIETEIKSAREIVGDDHADRAEAILRMPPGKGRTQQLKALCSELEAADTSLLMNSADMVGRLIRARDAEVANASSTREMMAKDVQSRRQEQEKQLRSVFDSAVQRAQDPEKGFDEFRLTGDSNHDAEVQSRLRTAAAIYTRSLPPEDMARAAIWAMIAPVMLQSRNAQIQEKDAKIAELESVIGKLKSVTPSPAGGGGGGEQSDAIDDGDMSVEAISRRALRSGAFSS